MKKKWFVMLSILLCLSLLFACAPAENGDVPMSNSVGVDTKTDAQTAQEVAESDVSDQTYAMVSFLSAQDHFVRCWNGFNAACSYMGVEAIHLAETEDDLASFLANVETAINMGVDGIAVACQNADAYVDVINQAIDADIPVVTYDSDSPDSNRLAYLSTGNYEAGQAAAEYIAEHIGGTGKVCFINRPGQENIEERCRGFKDLMAEKYPDIEVIEVGVESGVEPAAAGAAAALAAHPDLRAFMGGGGTQGTPCLTSVKELGLQDQVSVMCFDLNEDTLEAVQSGEAIGTIMQGTYNMGWYCAQFLFNYANDLTGSGAGGGFLPPRVDTGVVVVNQDNFDNYITK